MVPSFKALWCVASTLVSLPIDVEEHFSSFSDPLLAFPNTKVSPDVEIRANQYHSPLDQRLIAKTSKGLLLTKCSPWRNGCVAGTFHTKDVFSLTILHALMGSNMTGLRWHAPLSEEKERIIITVHDQDSVSISVLVQAISI